MGLLHIVLSFWHPQSKRLDTWSSMLPPAITVSYKMPHLTGSYLRATPLELCLDVEVGQKHKAKEHPVKQDVQH